MGRTSWRCRRSPRGVNSVMRTSISSGRLRREEFIMVPKYQLISTYQRVIKSIQRGVSAVARSRTNASKLGLVGISYWYRWYKTVTNVIDGVVTLSAQLLVKPSTMTNESKPPLVYLASFKRSSYLRSAEFRLGRSSASPIPFEPTRRQRKVLQ